MMTFHQKDMLMTLTTPTSTPLHYLYICAEKKIRWKLYRLGERSKEKTHPRAVHESRHKKTGEKQKEEQRKDRPLS